nr:MAG: MatK/TrnK amino terminal region [Bacteriophage sp.]
MRSYNNLYEKMLQNDYIEQCFKDASEKKRNRNDVQKVMMNLEAEVETLKTMLQEEMFIPDNHKLSIINESSNRKTRRILKPNYKYEQVVHHCVIGQFKSVVMNGLYEFSCGSIPGRGVHYGKKYMRKWIDSYNGKKMYVLKMDIRHFFESIDRTILKKKIKEVIRDKRFYRMLCILIEFDRVAEVAELLTDAGVEISIEQTKEIIGDIALNDDAGALNILRKIGINGKTFEETKKSIESRKKGVPLGYFTSQWFGNFYLKKLDHYIKEELKADDFMRYLDDMVILGKSKKKLHRIQREIEKYLRDELRLELKGDWQVFRFEYPMIKNGENVLDKDGKPKTNGRMLDFMGFQFHHDRTTIRKSNLESARRKANHIDKQDKISWYNASAMLSYMGLFKHTDTYGYYEEYIKPKVNVKKLKRIVSKHSRKENEKRERMEDATRNAAGETGGNRRNILTDDRVLATEH